MHVLMLTQRVDADHDILGFTVDWIQALAAEVDRLDVVTGYAGRYDLPENVQVESYGKERDFSKPRRVLAFERLCARYATENVDVVFAHMIPKYVLASWPWLGAGGTPYVLWYAHREVTWDLRLATRLVDAIVTPTEESFRLDSEKVNVVGHGIDTDRFSPRSVSSDRSRLLGVGRIDPVKRFETLIEAVDVLVSDGRGVDLRLVGEPSADGSYLERLNADVNDRELTDHVTFVGAVPHDQIVDQYRQAGVFLNASRTGSLDKTEIEAMACGTPVVSCNESYVEMIRETGLDETLLTFPEGDAGMLAERVSALLDLSHDEYERLRAESQTVARTRHDTSALMGSIADICEQVSHEISETGSR